MSHPHALRKSQKMAAAGLAFFAFLVVVVWAVQFKNGLKKPFDLSALKPKDSGINSATEAINPAICPGPDCQMSDEDLKMRDTDGDGLSDFDEYVIFNTSAFLEDSDSDGVPDKKEIDSGTDPNCPSDRDCDKSPLVESPTSDSAEESTVPVADSLVGLKTGTSTQSANVTGSATDTEGIEYEDLISGKADAASLRALLKASGMTDEMLSKISDEELLKTYAEQVKGQ